MKYLKILVPILFFALILIISCDNEATNQEKILGTWISTDKSVTLDFIDNNSFHKNGDNYDYKLYDDSIEVRYNGILKIFVSSTKHKYTLSGKTLIIDFSNKICYGFDSQKATFMKK